MANLILEVGVEEMPANAVSSALEQLKLSVTLGLEERRLGARDVKVLGTPRRLILQAYAIPQQQPDMAREVKGPPVSVAFNSEGHPTPAGVGFAKKQGVDVKSLQKISTPQGEYVVATVLERGKPAEEALGGMLEEAVKSLYFPKMMRWGDNSIRFVRPLRWIVAMLDDKIVPMEINGVRSSNQSRGHRFLSPEPFIVDHADWLVSLLERKGVICDPQVRREEIIRQAKQLATESGGVALIDEELLEENNWLVEKPTALLGKFQSEFLDLPRPVLVTAMKKHQRFFPVEDSNGRLLPLFISIRNGGDKGLDIVRAGNERVLTSRFSDARYFYNQDMQEKLENMVPRLSRLVFQEKLGTLFEKRARLMELTKTVAEKLNFSASMMENAVRAASLAKADLVSHMVVELPSLQGVMGREYAIKDGEDGAVAEAIYQHYLPRYAGDKLPDTPIGRLIAVCDRIDTLVGYLGLEIVPTGSSDPFGLRRAAQGATQILIEEIDYPTLDALTEFAVNAYKNINGLAFDSSKLSEYMHALFNQRMEALLEDAGVRYDVVNAALNGGIPSESIGAIWKRSGVLQNLIKDSDFTSVLQAAVRTSNILKSAKIAGAEVDSKLFEEACEGELLDAAHLVAAEIKEQIAGWNFQAIYASLKKLTEPVNRFFDGVLVMSDNEAVRRNRIALLKLVQDLYLHLADFTRIV
jgi:glycyl-tRNA synthetase beta chain